MFDMMSPWIVTLIAVAYSVINKFLFTRKIELLTISHKYIDGSKKCPEKNPFDVDVGTIWENAEKTWVWIVTETYISGEQDELICTRKWKLLSHPY